MILFRDIKIFLGVNTLFWTSIFIYFLGCPSNCFDHCLRKYGGHLFHGNTYYCQKGCAEMSKGKTKNPNFYCSNIDDKLHEKCKSNCQAKTISSKKEHRKRCEYGCTFWNDGQTTLYSGELEFMTYSKSTL